MIDFNVRATGPQRVFTLSDPIIIGTDGDPETGITMVFTTATDPSGVEYSFAEISGNPGGSDSGWQDSPGETFATLEVKLKNTLATDRPVHGLRQRSEIMNPRPMYSFRGSPMRLPHLPSSSRRPCLSMGRASTVMTTPIPASP
jgi:hypothetical protein